MASLFIARLPTLSNVEVFEAELVVANRYGPYLQHLKSKCRELARSESCLMVSPTTTALHSTTYYGGARPPLTLWIMTKTGYIGNPKLQHKLKHLGIKIVRKEVCVSETVLQTCYQFSLTARLAPKWNLFTSWLVQGTDFLSTERPAHAVVLEVGVTKTEITLSVNVHRLIFNFLKPSDLEVSNTTVSSFLSDPQSIIKENSITNNRCILMPNMTVGYVYSVSHRLPSSPEFPTYDSVRLHWKKQHGMILPEKQNIFFQIFFKSNSRTFFSYPGCCVLNCPPTVCSSRDSRAVASSFITDLHSRIPTLCGEAIRYSNKALTPYTHLHSAATSNTTYPNVRPAPIASCHYTSNTGRPQALTNGGSKSRGPGSSLIGHVSAAIASSSSIKANTQSVPDINRLEAGYNGGTKSRGQSSQHVLYHQDGCKTAPVANNRIVPVFKPSHRQNQQIVVQQKQQTRSTPIVPSFKPNRTTSHTQHTTMTSSDSMRCRPTVPSVNQQRQLGQKHSLTEFSQPSLPPPKHCRMNTQVTTSRPTNGSKGGSNLILQQQQSHLGKEVLSSGRLEQLVPNLQADMDCHFMTDKEQTLMDRHDTGQQTPIKKGKGVKAMIQVEGVSEDIINKMYKVKVPLLKKWLQENGVKCTGRKTKDDLVRMAANYVRDTGTIFTIPS